MAASVRHGDKYYIMSVLEDVFGNEIRNYLQHSPVNNPRIFGGSCSLLEELYVKKNGKLVNLKPMYSCENGISDSKLSEKPKNLLLRTSYMNSICLDLTSHIEVVKRGLIGSYVSNDKAYLTSRMIKKFYPLFDFSKMNVSNVIKIIDAKKISNKDIFMFDVPELDSYLKQLSYLLCLSEDWQQI